MVLELPGGIFGQSDVRETTSQSSLLANKTSFYSIPGSGFSGITPDVDDVIKTRAELLMSGNNIDIMAPVHLPQGAIVTACIVHGNTAAEDETWELSSRNITNGSSGTIMASGAVNTSDSSITEATIDNQNNTYIIRIGTLLQSGDIIHSAVITYTTDYD